VQRSERIELWIFPPNAGELLRGFVVQLFALSSRVVVRRQLSLRSFQTQLVGVRSGAYQVRKCKVISPGLLAVRCKSVMVTGFSYARPIRRQSDEPFLRLNIEM